MTLWLAVLLYVGAAAGFYATILLTAKEMPDEIAEALATEERGAVMAIVSDAHHSRPHAA